MFENDFPNMQINTINENLCSVDFILYPDEIKSLLKKIIDNNLINKFYFKITQSKHNKFSMSIQTNCR